MGIIPLLIGAKLTTFFFIEKFSLINKARSRVKVFEPFEDTSKSSMISAILISYGCVLNDQANQL